MIRLYFNGKEYTDQADGISSLEITIEPDAKTGFSAIGISSSIKATGSLYELIYNTFYADTCKGKDQVLSGKVKISKNSCDLEFNVEIRPESIDICLADGCCDFQLKLASDDDEAFYCLRNQQNFWKDNGFAEYVISLGRAYKILYCIEFGLLTWIIWSLSYTVFGLIRALADALCTVAEFLGIKDQIAVCEKIESLERLIIQCNKYHIATLFRDMFEYNAKKCNLEFDSQLLQQDPIYSCLAIESAVENEGWVVDNCKRADRQYNPGNQENWNILQLAVKLIPVFNGYAIIRKGKLIFDHISRRYAELTYLFNAEKEYMEGRVDECPTYNVDPEKLYAFLQLQYTRDGLEAAGNRMINKFNETIEWNEGGARKNNLGNLTNTFDFAPVRFNNDLVDFDFVDNAGMAAVRQKGDGGCSFMHAQILSNGQMGLSKLLIIDKNEKMECNGCSFATVVKKFKYVAPTGEGPLAIFEYNDPMKGQQLYDRFWSYSDPNSKTARYVKISEIKWRPENFCDAVNIILENKLEVNVESAKYGNAHPNKISINFEVCEITFSDMYYKCDK